MEFLDEDTLEVIPLFVIRGDVPGPSSTAGSNQGNIPDKSPHKDDMHFTDRAIRNLVTRILNEGHAVKGKTLPSKKPVDGSHETTENDINMEEESSEEEDDTLVHHVKPSVARKLKTRKRKTVVEMMTVRRGKKVAGVRPFKSWSKVETVKKSPGKVAVVHLDNISFHLEDGAAKWMFVIQRKVVVEMELGKEAVEVKEVMELIKVVGLMKTVVALLQCFDGLVKEFVMNIPEDISEKSNKEFCKVFVRG
ncbi:uncharacterized protein LOC127079022 [Lathyrus oleraceus]|uniref:uncharacterized protein LOC127079022 n=1 Tax=Pisum sativum TaxID=3888 RepID=UPI0021CFFE2C|nr:uncharacterized protein LOC127079022 [Pisum sativum]